jgi:hypothetical protein
VGEREQRGVALAGERGGALGERLRRRPGERAMHAKAASWGWPGGPRSARKSTAAGACPWHGPARGGGRPWSGAREWAARC